MDFKDDSWKGKYWRTTACNMNINRGLSHMCDPLSKFGGKIRLNDVTTLYDMSVNRSNMLLSQSRLPEVS